MGDPGKLIILESVIRVIKEQNLLENVRKTGNKLKNGLFDIEKDFGNLVNSTRGRGTFLAINAANTKLRDEILVKLKTKGNFQLFYSLVPTFFLNLGIQSGGCGEQSIRLRPALIFQEHHADIFLDKFRQVLKEIN